MTEPGAGHHPRILVVEDDPAIRGLIATVALKADLDVSEASNGAEAARMLQEKDFAVITLDLMLPTVSGYKLLDQLAREGCRSCLVLITAASDDDLMKIDQSFIFEIIRKPFDIETIRDTLLKAIEEQRQIGTRLPIRDDGNHAESTETGPASSDESRDSSEADRQD